MARHAEPEIADLLEHGKTAKGNAVVNRRIRGELRPAVRESADPDVYCYALSKRFLSVRRSSLSTRPRTRCGGRGAHRASRHGAVTQDWWIHVGEAGDGGLAWNRRSADDSCSSDPQRAQSRDEPVCSLAGKERNIQATEN